MWELSEVAALFKVTRHTVQQWLRDGLCEFRLKHPGNNRVYQVIDSEALIKLYEAKFKVPGDGSLADLDWQAKVERRRKAVLARWARARALQAPGADRLPKRTKPKTDDPKPK